MRRRSRRRAQSRYTCEVPFLPILGEADQIKEYVLAVEVLGRGDSFDPQLDPIARVEAGRLRKKLDEHYLTEGRNDSILIELPKGRYVPVFRKRQPQLADIALTRRWFGTLKDRQKFVFAALISCLIVAAILGRGYPPTKKLALTKVSAAADLTLSGPAGREAPTEAIRPSIVVLPFADLSPDKDQGHFSDVLTEETYRHAVRYAGLAGGVAHIVILFQGNVA